MQVPIYLSQVYISYYLLRHCGFYMKHFEVSLPVSKIEHRDRAGRKRAWKIAFPTKCYRKALYFACFVYLFTLCAFCAILPMQISYKNPLSTRNITIFCSVSSVSSMRCSICNVYLLIPRDTDATVFIADCLLC